jgi:hypothetical protein
MISICLVELGLHVGREFLLGDGPIVIGVHYYWLRLAAS